MIHAQVSSRQRKSYMSISVKNQTQFEAMVDGRRILTGDLKAALHYTLFSNGNSS